jgi:hypothetical protein
VNYRDDTQGSAMLHLEYSLKTIFRVPAAGPPPATLSGCDCGLGSAPTNAGLRRAGRASRPSN